MKKILYKILCSLGFHKVDEENWTEFWDEFWDEETGDEYCETGLENYCLRCKKQIKKYND